MAPLPKTSIDHFTHEGHPLNAVENDKEFLCDGCKTLGTGKRYRCNVGCDFDLHDYCGTCPRLLSTFMHPHSLTLVMRRPQPARQTNRICDVCRDPVEGLFYRCADCEFDVHPLCTQLPHKLNHALHKIHPLTLQSPLQPNFCSVCKNSCTNWRYRCSTCNLDIHLECVLAPVVSCPQHEQTSQRGIPRPGHAQHAPPNYYNGPGYPNYGPGYHYMYPQQYYYVQPQNNYQQVGATNNGSRLGKSMFSLVGQLGFGVLSNMIFGVDVASFL